MMSSNFQQVIDLINEFRDEREWRQFHNAKDLALSISLEASELLELFQWKSSEEVLANNVQGLREEISDVLIYALMLADDLGFDPYEIIIEKIENNARKYPINKARGSSLKYSEL